jgi:hypothetical protein
MSKFQDIVYTGQQTVFSFDFWDSGAETVIRALRFDSFSKVVKSLPQVFHHRVPAAASLPF